MRRIYLDHAATTPVLPEVREAMAPWLGERFGNPSSLHAEGRQARAAVDAAREILSQALGSLFAEVLFTSSGTEAANLAVLGSAIANGDASRNRILVGAAEHHCVLHTRELAMTLGYRFELLPVDRVGRLRVDVLEERMGEDVLLVSVMHANNELGVIQPVADVSRVARRHGALFHCDAVQTFLQEAPGRWSVEDIGADMISLSAHKVNGPKGVGAIYVRAGVKLKPLAVGGGQEREMRAGTENVAGIVGFAEAVRGAPADAATRKRAARDAFLDALGSDAVPTVQDRTITLAGHAHVRVPGCSAETLLIVLDRMGVSASSGAACSAGSLEASHVLLACGYSDSEAREGLRFTFGWETTVEDAVEAAERVSRAIRQVRGRA